MKYHSCNTGCLTLSLVAYTGRAHVHVFTCMDATISDVILTSQ